MKKIPISFNDNELAEVKEATEMIGISGLYGDFPKAVKYGIKLIIAAAKNPEKVYSLLDEPELTYYLTSIKKAELLARIRANAENQAESIKKV